MCHLTQVSQGWSPVNLPRVPQALAVATAVAKLESILCGFPSDDLELVQFIFKDYTPTTA